MRSMGEICERPSALNRFLANRQGDVVTRIALRNFQRWGVKETDEKVGQDLVLTTETIARGIDIVDREIVQDLRALNAVNGGQLTPPLVEYAVRHSRRIARLASALG